MHSASFIHKAPQGRAQWLPPPNLLRRNQKEEDIAANSKQHAKMKEDVNAPRAALVGPERRRRLP